MGKMDDWIVLQHFMISLRSGINYHNVLRVELGDHDDKVRNEKK